MNSKSRISSLDATALAELVRNGEYKPIDLVEASIERIEKLNPKINAVITPMFEQARKTSLDESLNGPFSGVPFLVKDNIPYGGVRTASGSKILRDFIPKQDCEQIKRIKRSGLIILGKTNTPEFGLLPTTEPHLFGPTRNPWDIELSAGGSSGGSAAAVACRMVPMAHGNDGGGSIRIPASCCGLFGLKPTRARTHRINNTTWIAVDHALTISVRDSAALLDATSGPTLGDPFWAPSQIRPFLKEVGVDPGRLRIAFTAEQSNEFIHSDCVKATYEVAELCTELGHEVIEKGFNYDFKGFVDAFLTVFASSLSSGLVGISNMIGKEPNRDWVEPGTWGLYEKGREHRASEFLQALQEFQVVSRELAHFMVDFDIYLTPTLAEPPVPLGTFDSTPEEPLKGIYRAIDFVPFTPLCNATGVPAMSVPLFWNNKGLPIGSHFIGRFGDEATLFRLASQLENARPWADKKPPIIC